MSANLRKSRRGCFRIARPKSSPTMRIIVPTGDEFDGTTIVEGRGLRAFLPRGGKGREASPAEVIESFSPSEQSSLLADQILSTRLIESLDRDFAAAVRSKDQVLARHFAYKVIQEMAGPYELINGKPSLIVQAILEALEFANDGKQHYLTACTDELSFFTDRRGTWSDESRKGSAAAAIKHFEGSLWTRRDNNSDRRLRVAKKVARAIGINHGTALKWFYRLSSAPEKHGRAGMLYLHLVERWADELPERSQGDLDKLVESLGIISRKKIHQRFI